MIFFKIWNGLKKEAGQGEEERITLSTSQTEGMHQLGSENTTKMWSSILLYSPVLLCLEVSWLQGRCLLSSSQSEYSLDQLWVTSLDNRTVSLEQVLTSCGLPVLITELCL